MKTLRALLLAISTLFALAAANATTVIPPTFDELVTRAQQIFQGTVTDVQSQWVGEGAHRHIVTYVTFNVEDSLKGDATASYSIRMLGGTVGDETMEVTDAPKFKVGDRDILFVENNGSQFIPLVGIMHGRFKVQRDEGAHTDVVVSEHGEALGDLSQLGKEPAADSVQANAAAPVAKAMPAADFKAAIVAKLNAVR